MAVPHTNHTGQVQGLSNYHGSGRTDGDDQREITGSALMVAVCAIVVRVLDEVLIERRFILVRHRAVQRVKMTDSSCLARSAQTVRDLS